MNNLLNSAMKAGPVKSYMKVPNWVTRINQSLDLNLPIPMGCYRVFGEEYKVHTNVVETCCSLIVNGINNDGSIILRGLTTSVFTPSCAEELFAALHLYSILKDTCKDTRIIINKSWSFNMSKAEDMFIRTNGYDGDVYYFAVEEAVRRNDTDELYALKTLLERGITAIIPVNLDDLVNTLEILGDRYGTINGAMEGDK